MNISIMWLSILILPSAKGTGPWSFSWNPRRGIGQNPPRAVSGPVFRAYYPTKDNINEGLVVLLDGYNVGVTIIALVVGITSSKPFLPLNPLSAYYYTNVYRWFLRYFSTVPMWLGGTGKNFFDTHKVWLKRYYYMDKFMPTWMRMFFPYVQQSEWEKEEKTFRWFRKYTDPGYGKHYHFPGKVFNKFKSDETEETVENKDTESKSLIDYYDYRIVYAATPPPTTVAPS